MRRLSFTAVLLVILAVQVALIAPANAIAGLRALTCCARGCDHARSLSDASRCCGVQLAEQLAVTPPAGDPAVPAFAVHPIDVRVVFGGPLVMTSIHQIPPRDRPPPIFLLVRSLRL